MRLTHFSDNFDLNPKPVIPGGSDVPGMFFYAGMTDEALEECARGWCNRIRFDYFAPDEVVEFVQDFFPGDAGNEFYCREVFVNAENLSKVERW